MDDLADQRRRLVAELRSEGIRDERVLSAIGRVAREAFVPAELRADAYRNAALPIGERQTISQPFVVALMTQALSLSGTEQVLEIGTGSGYQTAVLAELSRHVVTIERHASLLEAAGERLTALGYADVEYHLSDGSLGWPRGAPYDRVVVTAASPNVPEPLLRQLSPEGRLVVPVGSSGEQELLLIWAEHGRRRQRGLGPVRFVPLLGQAGWQASGEG